MAPDAPVDGSGHSARELIHLIRSEAVEHLDDLLLRRTTLAVSGQLSSDMVEATLALLAEERGWSADATATERQRFLTLLAERHGVSEPTLISRNMRQE